MQNSLAVIEDDQGTEAFDDVSIATIISSYFQNLFTGRNDNDLSLVDRILPCKVTSEMNT